MHTFSQLNMNKLFRILAVLICIASIIGVALGYTHQAVVTIIAIIMYMMTRCDKEEKEAPISVRKRRVFEVND